MRVLSVILSLFCAIGLVVTNVNASDMINLSARGHLTDSQVVSIGVVIDGENPKDVVAIAMGPSLGGLGSLWHQNPKMTVYDPDGRVIATNDDWPAHPTSSRLISTGMAPRKVTEPGVALTLEPGHYRFVLQSADGAAGDVVLLVRDMSPSDESVFNKSTDPIGLWSMYATSTTPKDENENSCGNAEGVFGIQREYHPNHEYRISASYLTVEEHGYTLTLAGWLDAKIFDISINYEGTKFGDAYGVMSGHVASGTWEDLYGCSGYWIALKQ